MQLQNMCKKGGHGSFQRICPKVERPGSSSDTSMTEKKMMTMIVDMLPVFYYEKMVGYTPSSFDDMVFTAERIDVGLKRGKFSHPAWTNEKTRANEEGEKTQQCHYSANNQPSPYPPPSYPQRPSLKQPQSLPTALPMTNTTFSINQNTNQEMNFAVKKPVEFTPNSSVLC